MQIGRCVKILCITMQCIRQIVIVAVHKEQMMNYGTIVDDKTETVNQYDMFLAPVKNIHP